MDAGIGGWMSKKTGWRKEWDRERRQREREADCVYWPEESAKA